jgi:hypothetical protein
MLLTSIDWRVTQNGSPVSRPAAVRASSPAPVLQRHDRNSRLFLCNSFNNRSVILKACDFFDFSHKRTLKTHDLHTDKSRKLKKVRSSGRGKPRSLRLAESMDLRLFFALFNLHFCSFVGRRVLVLAERERTFMPLNAADRSLAVRPGPCVFPGIEGTAAD